jgi:phage terminase small subunit
VAEYLVDLNATKAAIRAGYSENTAHSCGPRLLEDAGVKAAIAEGQAQRLDEVVLTAKGTLEAGNLKPIHTLTAEQAALIGGFEVVKRNLTSGDGTVDTIYKVKLKEQRGFVEMAMKHLGLLIEKQQVQGELTVRWAADETP